jgi:hypothetical protein
MDATSLSLSVLALGSVFENCSALYGCMRDARQFPTDQQRQVLFLSIEKERFEIIRKHIQRAIQLDPNQTSSTVYTPRPLNQNLVQAVLIQIEKELQHATSQMVKDQTSRSQIERLKWILRDKQEFEDATTNLRKLNDGLSSLVPDHIFARLELDLLSTLLSQDNQFLQDLRRNLDSETEYTAVGQTASVRLDYENLRQMVSSPHI